VARDRDTVDDSTDETVDIVTEQGDDRGATETDGAMT
jgi:hypothetical protein